MSSSEVNLPARLIFTGKIKPEAHKSSIQIESEAVRDGFLVGANFKVPSSMVEKNPATLVAKRVYNTYIHPSEFMGG